MRSSPNPGGPKPPRRRLFHAFDTNSRDENNQRHGRMVHIPFVAMPALPVIVIATPSPYTGESLLASLAAAFAAGIGRLVWNFFTHERRMA